MASNIIIVRQTWLRVHRREGTVQAQNDLVQNLLYSSIIQSENVSNFTTQSCLIKI